MTELTEIEVGKSGVPRRLHDSECGVKSRPTHIIMMLPRRRTSRQFASIRDRVTLRNSFCSARASYANDHETHLGLSGELER